MNLLNSIALLIGFFVLALLALILLIIIGLFLIGRLEDAYHNVSLYIKDKIDEHNGVKLKI